MAASVHIQLVYHVTISSRLHSIDQSEILTQILVTCMMDCTLRMSNRCQNFEMQNLFWIRGLVIVGAFPGQFC